MKYNLIFEHFTAKNVKSKDYFDRILNKVDDTYINTKSINNVYLAVDPELWQEYQDQDYTIFNREGRDYVNLSSMILTFHDIPEDYHEVRDHLFELYGKEAVRDQIVDEREISNGIPKKQ